MMNAAMLEHRFSNRATEEKSAQSQVNDREENRVNAGWPNRESDK